MDRISNLPSEILCHIVSFLSTKEAAFTLVLSKRWRNLFTIIPELHFDDEDEGSSEGSSEESSEERSCEERFDDFVNGVLALPISSRVRTFSLKWNREAHFDERINTCICNVLKRGVLVLKLHVKVLKGGCFPLPSEVFACRTVVELKLGSGFAIENLPADAFLPELKTLFLDHVRFYDTCGRCAFKTLLSVSPLLEDLVIDRNRWECWKWSGTVSSPTLRRLTIRRSTFIYEDYSDYSEDEEYIRLDCRGLAYDFDSISLDTPGLIYLEYSDYVPKEYPIVNLNSLVEAKLDLVVEDGRLWEEREHGDSFNPRNLINGLKNVEILDLTPFTLEMLFVFREVTPVFEKLSKISLELSNFCWVPVPHLLEKAPNLKTLFIEDRLHCGDLFGRSLCPCVDNYSFLDSCPVELLIIARYTGNVGELEQMKHFLGKLSCLELVEVHAQVSDDKKMQVMDDVLMLPRSSSKCKIKVKFSRQCY